MQTRRLRLTTEDSEHRGAPTRQARRADASPVMQLQRSLGNRALARGVPARGASSSSLPDPLRTRAEHLSGVSLRDVRVFRDSPAPRRFGALAHAEGGEIHLGPGQDGHLAHETWHVVQQRRGEVAARGHLGGHAFNADPRLEADADRFAAGHTPALRAASPAASPPIVQPKKETYVDKGQTPHAAWGDATDNIIMDDIDLERRPVVIEVMEYNANSARAKIDAIADSRPESGKDFRAIMIAFNRKVEGNHHEEDGTLKKNINLANSYDATVTGADALTDYMIQRGVMGGCFPMVWSPTDPKSGGYTFPFLETRARVTLHKGTIGLFTELGEPLVRSMDADVTNDPLLNNTLPESANDTFAGLYNGAILSGGYNWDNSAKPAEFWGLDNPDVSVLNALNTKLTACIDAINAAEHKARLAINTSLGARSVYWPEPNYYSSATTRLSGAGVALDKGKSSGTTAQQRESTYYLKEVDNLKGSYDKRYATTKPLKNYFTSLRDLILASRQNAIQKGAVDEFIQSIRQTHLNPGTVLEDIRKWNGATDDISGIEEKAKLAILTMADKLSTALQGVLKP